MKRGTSARACAASGSPPPRRASSSAYRGYASIIRWRWAWKKCWIMKAASAPVEIGGRLETQLEKSIAGAVLGEGLELHEQRRHQVERHPHVGKLAQERHHPVVVLERVQRTHGRMCSRVTRSS